MLHSVSLAGKLVYALWLTGITLQIVLSIALLSRRAWRQLPVFTGFSVFCLFQNVLCYALVRHPAVYPYVYWATESIVLVFGLAVIYEVFTKLLTAYPALNRLATAAFALVIGLLFLTSITVVWLHKPVEGSKLMAGFLVLEQAARISEVGLLVFLFSFSRIFGLHWRQQIFGIATGLGLYVIVELIGVTLRTYFGLSASPVFVLAGMLSYNLGLVIWIGYLLKPERVLSTPELPQGVQLEQWNRAVMELIHQ